jgi:hypothetical protein
MDLFGYHLPTLAGVGATFAFVYRIFAKFDSDQSDGNRKFIRDWLLGLTVDDRKWETFFREIFAKFFGPKHLSLRCVIRSTILSVSIILIIYAIWLGIDSTRVESFKGALGNLVFAILFATVCACIIDYLSLWKTRILLTKSHLSNRASTALLLVVGDFVATSFLFLFVYTLIAYTFFFIVGFKISPISLALEAFGDIYHENHSYPYRPVYLAALFTSAWLWVYLIVAYAIRLLHLAPSSLRHVSKIMDFEDHPVRTLGYLAATVSAVVVFIIIVA